MSVKLCSVSNCGNRNIVAKKVIKTIPSLAITNGRDQPSDQQEEIAFRYLCKDHFNVS